jgi:two-component system chemotaxis sensor kinase CheA
MKSSDREFIAEAEEILGEAGRLLLELQDSGANPDAVNALFRAFHTLKGLSGLFGHKGITDISHALESMLDDLRLGKVAFSGEFVDFLFLRLDSLRGIIEALKNGEETDASQLLLEIDNFRKGLSGSITTVSLHGLIDESLLKVLSEYEEHRLKTNISEGKGIYLLKKVFGLDRFDRDLESTMKSVKTKGELLSTLPTSEGVPAGHLGFKLLFASLKPLEELKEGLSPDTEEVLKPKAKETRAAAAAVSLKSASTTVRVDIEKLDRILNTIGELTLTKSALRRISDEMRDNYGHSALVLDVYRINQILERRLIELQEQVLEIRMVPVGQIFGRLSQVVKRYSREAGKQIELQLYGEDTEIDKYLAEEVVDPLVHIIRNAIDHGIETGAERVQRGKPAVGTVILKAYQRGNHVVIEARDDGRGINFEKVKEKAVEKGLIEKGATLQKREVLDLIFTPGFSTKDVVSDISGRGVGLDIVRDKLSSMGGFSDVESQEGQGTTITLTLPITLAIVKALIVRVGVVQFALPLTSISETHAIDTGSLQAIEGRKVFNLREEMLPVAMLSDIFELPTDPADRNFVVVVGFGERRMGILVNELMGQQEIVIKSLGDYFKRLKGFAGAAEIGKHQVILVLDIESLIEDSFTRQKGIHA